MPIHTKTVPNKRQNPSVGLQSCLQRRPATFTSAPFIVKLLQYMQSKSIEAGDFARGILMLTIFGSREASPFCDGLRRRDFIRIGGLSMGSLFSLSLVDLFARRRERGREKLTKR